MEASTVQRKLAAIFSADVKGYSRLMGEDEVATIRTLTTYRELMGTLIRQYRGRVVDSPGDNLLAEFASVVEGERIYGDGVNIAARLEGLADGGGLCISGSVYEQVESKLALTYEYMGEQTVKNISKPVRAYRVRELTDVSPPAQHAENPPLLPLPAKPSLAVLPFTNMSSDAEQEYF